MKLLRSPHPHARILAIDTAAALRVPGVHLVLTHHDAPERPYSSARHEHPTEDPDDTRLLDETVRYIGQRVAAVVAESEAAAEEGCRRIEVTYEQLPYVIDPEEAMAPGAPVIHDKGPEARIARPRTTSSVKCTAKQARWRRGSRRPTSSTRRPSAPSASSTQACRPMARWPGTRAARTAANGSPYAPAGKAVMKAADALAVQLREFAARYVGAAPGECRLTAEAVVCAGHEVSLKELFQAARAAGRELSADGHWGGSPRSVAFNAQWFRLAVDPGTGEIRILRSVHAADAGKVMNPMQCRGQVEGGVAQALGATLFENVRLDERGEVTTAALRRYRLPQFADMPRTEVHFMETSDAIGPLGAKSMSESPFNPVAPAFANALRDATGIRFTELPLTRDRVWLALHEAGRSRER